MNYIRHLQLVYQQFMEDERLNPSHISLYMAIFQEWNSARFPGELYINRQQLMLSSKVRSQSGYHRCIRELDVFGYLQYMPSHNPYQGSRVKMFTFRTSSEQADDHRDPILEQVAAHYYPKYEQVDEPYINSNKQQTLKNINNTSPTFFENEIILFFKKQNWPVTEAKKFFSYYQNQYWKTTKGNIITDWKDAAQKWIARYKRWQKEKKVNQDFLKTSKNKDYGQPL
ncbi:MAG: hypothetical protein CMP12_21435 [Zunongwangia sp.]|uniref:Uncharacterized protein n=2 Tax=Zunongwangia profunda TaxID=398743 RepID=D5BKG2_ZUNPS|nr:hypothetical protein [Zunongwangia profunda]ADF53874.1 conserved hypothetical protein [Zunongwangia profunda SM-A87]MAO38423.1 hypothetical protein [Zunongwangia sp.]MAS72034.1 hypothetical protein [Zunongwangia sp.]HCV81104.1 hypothetical protein [Zunongwangia profunda]|tara:strand:- start:561 stop:1241 length:681 start_codon:yes stop_codon:yes gene_type:complete